MLLSGLCLWKCEVSTQVVMRPVSDIFKFLSCIARIFGYSQLKCCKKQINAALPNIITVNSFIKENEF